MTAPLLTGRHVMIDGETFSTAKSGLFFQLGACEFFPEENRIGGTFNRYIDLGSSMAAGRMVDPGAILYWLDGPDEARKRHCAGLKKDPPSLVQVLHELTDFCYHDNGRRGLGRQVSLAAGVWSHGAAFDCAMLEDTYAAFGLETPFSHRDILDTRTIFRLAGFRLSIFCESRLPALWPASAPPHVAHDGESDAIAQALAVMEACRFLERRYPE